MSIDSNLAVIKLEISENSSSVPGENVSIPLLKFSCTDEGAQKVVQVIERIKSEAPSFFVQTDLSKPHAFNSEGAIFIPTSGIEELRALEQRIARAVKQTLGLPRAPSTLPFHVHGVRGAQKPFSESSSILLSIHPSTHLRVELSRSPKPSSPSTPLLSPPPQPSHVPPSLPEQRNVRVPIRFYSASPVPVGLNGTSSSRSALGPQQPASFSRESSVSTPVMPVIGRAKPVAPTPKLGTAPAPSVQAPQLCSAPSAAIPRPEASSAATQAAAAALVHLQTQPAAPSGRETLRREVVASLSVLSLDVAVVRSRLMALDPLVNSAAPKTEGEKRIIIEQIAELRTRVENLEGLADLIGRISRHFEPASTL